ncbi:glycoside hydrolase family 3 protein [Candidatus Xianfuyuplasma coldseepsis]|uniref:beta-glucosidase n=1 Tax=Candidatus Xianfuyuplasma coldseepsis TaxID=2782163 RepID=A0A7L7KPF0_9MOLU|nr:glycoside hydrolase family 3 protein [Xianfuyuplasma coldseepsis]QMS84425.1 glycoside hydrolase family 3 protein [Xianfuyuplasma coldseepsis]
MKKLILITIFALIAFLSACSNTPNVEDDDVDCTIEPTHEDCTDDPNDYPVEPTNPLLDPSYEYIDYNEAFDQDHYDQIMVEVEAILHSLTLAEKAAQMVQAERGSITPAQVRTYGVGSILSGGGSHPSSYNDSADVWYDMYEAYQDAALESGSGIPIIYGIDAVHGNNNLYGATIFPHNIGLGATNDPELIYNISKATAEEMLTTGINWTFAPALSVVQNIRWGRTYEGYSENPMVHDRLTYQAIAGFQDAGVAATAKHYLGDGGTYNGIDQGNVIVANDIVEALHLAPYLEAVKADVDTVMISYSSINGVKMHGHDYWINDVLKGTLGFKGFVISDWNAIHQLSGSFEYQVEQSINAGVDMLMEPSRWQETIQAIVNNVNNNKITEERINDAVSRILYIKFKRGLIDDPYARLSTSYLYNQEHQDLAREAVRKSLVLLKNDDNALPLAKDDTIYITGPGANNVGYMSGGWTTYWQGNNNADIGVGTSIYDAFYDVISSNGGQLVNNMTDASTVVVVLAETPYSEGVGDNGTLTLTSGNAHPDNTTALQIAQTAQANGKNVIGILISGRPLLLEDHLESFDAFIAAWLPGSEGGLGIRDVVFGDYNFTGTLAFTWPIDFAQVGYTSNEEDYDEDSVLFPFGYGLQYID